MTRNLNLFKVSAPIAILEETGINDDLNGVEKPVSLSVRGWKGRLAGINQGPVS